MKPNRNYKDSVFTKLFGHDKKMILELYNAIFNTDYGENTNIEITTLNDVLFMDWINDISFVIDGKLVVLIEHQSTINENMPLRMLIYMARIYEQICDRDSMYLSKMMEIPAPEFVVLYNGKEEYPDKKELKLSDMFAKHKKKNPINLEVTVQVYNINKGRNPELARRSVTLDEYETFTAEIRENEKTMSFAKAVVKAVKDCKNKGVLKEFLRKHSSEVINMLFGEWDMNTALRVREKEGIREGILQTARNMKNMGIDVDTIAKATGLFVDDILRL